MTHPAAEESRPPPSCQPSPDSRSATPSRRGRKLPSGRSAAASGAAIGIRGRRKEASESDGTDDWIEVRHGLDWLYVAALVTAAAMFLAGLTIVGRLAPFAAPSSDAWVAYLPLMVGAAAVVIALALWGLFMAAEHLEALPWRIVGVCALYPSALACLVALFPVVGGLLILIASAVFVLLLVAGGVIVIRGWVLCARAPGLQMKALAIIALLVAPVDAACVAAAGFRGLLTLWRGTAGSMGVSTVLSATDLGLGWIPFYVAQMLLAFFLQEVANLFHDRDAQADARAYCAFLLILVALESVTGALSYISVMPAALGGILHVLIVFYRACAFVRFPAVIRSVREAVP